ncbi:hypothetical protein A2714_05110 [Candidatus Woesebacteria bacterium RIFCSPHIGHO2_01_FULL_38_9]|uniref:PPM-type phosphatase domain-containing protein n=2 Tax=Candidatus Woeseibacteriota TaxID=1752722 RepID=A0A1F7XZ07_9BACT|nr:MAG: hypothetical protein A2714_05110 [Candidatus Woesebacteria bacterium RIFCSPHIGHO2_01_FULL_38_9]OGM59179.1 MAG: hypothetical protein A3A75_03095 [Candidatus Woesebacteria bacterium RIFCSPLOWO2_01_FULL_39_10]
MSFTTVSAKLTGNPDKAGWAQAYEFSPEDEVKLVNRGHFFSVISTSRKGEGIDNVLAGREVLSRLHEEYFGSTGEKVLDALRSATQKVITEFSSWEDVEIASVALTKNMVYLSSGGGAQIALLRDGALVQIIKSAKGEVVTASGFAKDKDVLIIGTNSFFQTFSSGIIKGAILGKDPNLAVEALAPTIHSHDASGNIGAFFLRLEEVKLESLPDINAEENNREGIESYDSVKKITDVDYTTQPKPYTSRQNIFAKALKNLREKSLYVSKAEGFNTLTSSQKRVSASVGVLLIILLGVSIFFGIRQKQEQEKESFYKEKFTAASHNLEEAEELHSLNPSRARELLLEARESVLGLTSDGVEQQELQELKKKIEEREREILGEYREEAKVFVDLSLLSEGFKADAIALSGLNAYVLDKEGKRIIRATIDSKRSEVVTGPHIISEVYAFAVYSDRVFTLNNEGIFEVDSGGKNSVIENDWLGMVLPYVYAGNFYILDPNASMIYRYSGTEDGFGGKNEWLAPGTSADLSEAISVIIDGSVWVLTKENDVLKFTLGNPQQFHLSGIFPELTEITSFYTNESLKYIYFLDRDSKRIVVVVKDGEYKAQYVSDEIGNSRGLVVSEEERKIILLTSDKLFSIDLKHLD